jgi:uncharacterized protein Yka (UPF0111/DUF47 family)
MATITKQEELIREKIGKLRKDVYKAQQILENAKHTPWPLDAGQARQLREDIKRLEGEADQLTAKLRKILREQGDPGDAYISMNRKIVWRRQQS